MKKLLTACAACVLAGMVSAQVESVNVVGYQTKTAPSGFSLFSPTFITVGSDTTNGALSEIQGDFADFDTIQFVDADGNISAIYQWLTPAGFGVPVAGWYDGDFNAVDISTLPQGASYLLSTAAQVDVVNAGEVNLGETQTNLSAGFAAAGNATPTARMLSEFVFDNGITDFDTIQFVNAEGNISTIYQWLTPAGFGVPVAGWYDGDFNAVDREIAPGEGFLLSTSAGCSMTIPSPTAM